MTDQQMSFEQQLAALQKRTKCPLAEGKLFVFIQAMDPYNRRRIVLECLAKRRMVRNPAEWKIDVEEIERVCCDPGFADSCQWYKAIREQS